MPHADEVCGGQSRKIPASGELKCGADATGDIAGRWGAVGNLLSRRSLSCGKAMKSRLEVLCLQHTGELQLMEKLV